MAKNKIADGKVLTMIAPAGGVVSGTGYKIGDIFGVATVSADAGAEFALDLEGVYPLPKAAAITPNPGVKLYWDDTAKAITTTASGNTLVGAHAGKVAAGAADVTIRVRLNGAF